MSIEHVIRALDSLREIVVEIAGRPRTAADFAETLPPNELCGGVVESGDGDHAPIAFEVELVAGAQPGQAVGAAAHEIAG